MESPCSNPKGIAGQLWRKFGYLLFECRSVVGLFCQTFVVEVLGCGHFIIGATRTAYGILITLTGHLCALLQNSVYFIDTFLYSTVTVSC